MPGQQKKKKKQGKKNDGGRGLYEEAMKEHTPATVKGTLLRQAIKAGHLEASAEYGLMLYEGQLGPGKAGAAQRILLEASEKGCGRATCLLGKIEKPRKVEMFTKAGAQGYGPAYFELGLSWQQEGDSVKAVEAFQKGVPDPDATYQLALCYQEGIGIGKDDVEAARLYQIAAAKGQGYALTNLGNMYARGEGGLDKSPNEARRCWTLAAEQGVWQAQGVLGRCYLHGQHVKPDVDEAVKWFRRAADAGDASSQYDLAKLLEDGRHLQRDVKEATRLYQLAADQGFTKARGALERIDDPGRDRIDDDDIVGSPLIEVGGHVDDDALDRVGGRGRTTPVEHVESLIGGLVGLDDDRKLRICANCGLETTAKLQKCGRCRRVRYCSLECQEAHWPSHRIDCRRRTKEVAIPDDIGRDNDLFRE